MSALSLTGPLPQDMANARVHWSTRHRARKRYHATLDLLALSQRFRIAAPLPRAVVTIELRTWNTMDPDNLQARCKDVLDWLVTRQFLVDDSPAHVTLRVSQRIARLNRGITVTLEQA